MRNAALSMTQTADAPAQKRIATYERVSSEDQRRRETIKTQTEQIAQRLEDNPEVCLVGRYVDDGVSGTIPMAKRPGGARLLRDAERGLFSELWVYSVDRLGRGWVDPEVVWEKLEGYGVSIYSVSENVSDRLVYHIMAGLAARKREDFLRHARGGMDRAAREGRYCGGIVLYGYGVEGYKNTARLVPADEIIPGTLLSETEVVRLIFEAVAHKNKSCRQVARELNALAIPTRYQIDGRGVRGKKTQGRWGAGRILQIVNNPTYRGELAYGRRSQKPRDIITAQVPAIVSDELWQEAQEALARNRRIPKNTDRIYLLRSVIYCGQCGRAFCGTQSKGHGWYRCNGTLNRVDVVGERCSAKIVKGEHLEDPIWSDIERFLRDPGDIIEELSSDAESQAAADTMAREREHWQAALHEHQSRRERLLDLYQNGFITRSEFEERLQTVEDGRSEAQRRLEGLEPPDEAEAAEPLPDDLLAEIRRRLDAGLSDAERAEIIRLLVRRVTVFTDVGDDGRKRQRVLVDYRFSVGGLTHTGKRARQNYTHLQRTIQLPAGRYRTSGP